jgi:hypothetical protein
MSRSDSDYDFLKQPLTPIKGASRRRLPAALPIALAGILVVTAVAFGAGVVQPLITANATPVVVGDDEPEATPTPEATAEPTAEPTAAPLSLTAELDGFKVDVAWTAYSGDDFAYYKVVRSTDATVEWPLGEGDSLVAAIPEIDKLSTVDSPPGGKTYTYGVFAVKGLDDGYAVIVGSNTATVAVPEPTPAPTPKPTPKPTANCNMSLTATVKAASADQVAPNVIASSGFVVRLTWTKYQCDNFEWYVVVRSEDGHPDVPLPHANTSGFEVTQDVNILTWTDTRVQAGHTYYYRVMAWNSKVFCNGGTVLGKTNIASAEIPAA